MLEPILCGPVSRAPLLPKLRGHFAEFLNDASPVGLRILSSPTCVGLRYGRAPRNSGFSRHPFPALRYFSSLRPGARITRKGFPFRLLAPVPRSLRSRVAAWECVPAVLTARGTGFSASCPSATPLGLALGPDLPRADQLYPGNLGYSAGRIPTFLSLLIPAFSLHVPPPPLAGAASPKRQCSPTNQPKLIPWLRCQVLAPDIFGAGPLDQ